jgi:hypothetical protein
MNNVCRLDTKTIEMFQYVDKLIERNYPIDHRDCMRQAVREFVPEYELIDIYSLYGITYDEYITDMASSYLRYKSQKVSEMWRRANSTEQ